GLEPRDRKYLDTLIRIFSGGPTGVEAIAHTMNTATVTFRDQNEPYLLRGGYKIRTPRGRIATDTAWQHMGKHPPVEEPDPDTDQGELF
ncbi:MAG: Holliday junction branch migration DNA helicase RuvB, partial [Planctomycetes bacterium]|nr:Holliday junction branch migration DNA helicase RuvB [Planctomycetota bacterium]